jgi:hypothetical protein
MINFFRKIRKKLADDNKPLKYMRYAIGEIVLVVIGILIALQINNWNEARLQKEQINKYLATLVKELNEDKKFLLAKINTNSYRVHSVQRLFQFAGVNPINFGSENVIEIIPYTIEDGKWKVPDSLTMEFIDIAMNMAGRGPNLAIKTNTIDELKNTGMFSQMENTALKSAISNYYDGPVKTLEVSNTKETKYIEEWERSFIDDGLDVYNILSEEDPLSVLKENKSRVQVLKFMITETNWNALISDYAIKTIDELIPMIEAEIKK